MIWNWIDESVRLRNEGREFCLVTVATVSGSTPRETGAKMIVLGDGEFFGTIGGGELENQVIADAAKLLKAGEAKTVRYPLGAKTGQCCGGVVEILFEMIGLGPKLYVFGAGHVGQAVARTLGGTSFQVHLIDSRPEWLNSESIPPSVIRHDLEWQDFLKRRSFEDSFVVIMTHSHALDLEILSGFLRKPLSYLGLIGSRSKWVSFKRQLVAAGFSESEIASVRCPIGIEKFGKAPQEIAISFAAEVLSLWNRKMLEAGRPKSLALNSMRSEVSL